MLLFGSVGIACLGVAAETEPAVTAVNVSGRIQSQTLVRHPNAAEYHLIQQRSTFLLHSQWEPDTSALDRLTIGLLADARFSLLYRAAYDSVYEYTPRFRELMSRVA